MFIGKYNCSVIVTYLGVLSTMIGLFLLLGFNNSYVTGSIICLMISGICDMFDGKVARMCKNRTDEDIEYGIQIDSLTDMVSFIAFPIIIFYSLSRCMDVKLYPLISVPIVTLFVIAGISRLAHFNLSTNKKGTPINYYSGLPVTSTAIIFPLAYLFKYVLDSSVFIYIYLGIFLIVAFLFILNFKLKKIVSNWWYIMLSILALLFTGVLLYLKYGK